MRGDIVETYKRLGGWMKKVSGLIFFFSLPLLLLTEIFLSRGGNE